MKVLFLLVVVTFLFLVLYFKPKPLGDKLGLEGMDSSGTAYCTFLDISEGPNKDWSGPALDLLGQTNELFGLLLHEVSLSGPVFYKKASINPDLVNLYFSLPKEDGTYEKRTVEIILSYGENKDTYSAFINLDKKGYFVPAGKENLASFIQKVREFGMD